eukprot:869392-Amphidinium_carterae.1
MRHDRPAAFPLEQMALHSEDEDVFDVFGDVLLWGEPDASAEPELKRQRLEEHSTISTEMHMKVYSLKKLIPTRPLLRMNLSEIATWGKHLQNRRLRVQDKEFNLFNSYKFSFLSLGRLSQSDVFRRMWSRPIFPAALQRGVMGASQPTHAQLGPERYVSLRDHFREVRERLGSQCRSLRIASACSGMGTHNFALKDTWDHL